MTAFFMTSSGTDVGKTLMGGLLAATLSQKQRNVGVFKPVISGFDTGAIHQSDSALLLAAAGQEVTLENIEKISPWRYKAPLSPHIAARMEGAPLLLEDIVSQLRQDIQLHDISLIEGAGGIMSPLTEQHTNLDLIGALKLPTIAVFGNYLGSISHNLSALSVMQQAGINPALIIIYASEDGVCMDETAEACLQFGKKDIPIVKINRLSLDDIDVTNHNHWIQIVEQTPQIDEAATLLMKEHQRIRGIDGR